MFIIFVEGFDDEQYIKKIFPSSKIKIYQYAQKKREIINNYINSLACMNASYIFLADSDGKSDSDKIGELCEAYSQLDRERIYIVKFEIESWYLAGVSEDYCDKNKIKKYIHITNDVTKEQFDNLLPLNRKTRMQAMLDMLEQYQMSIALNRNSSLNNFITKEELINAV